MNNYQKLKERARAEAIEWQWEFAEDKQIFCSEIAEQQEKFTKLAKRSEFEYNIEVCEFLEYGY